MKKIVCEMCNASDFVKQDGLFVCQCCGMKYTLEETRKMMVEGVVEVRGSHTLSILNPFMKKDVPFLLENDLTLNVYGKSFGMDVY